ncbi:hypothetical protein [Kitasatospora sp. NPDC001527]|uniref:hypothetical protein n=1 Tax=Kitasatospora sp. NPDC001527 TaxID=3154519 RepID=UPI0033347679
MTHGLVDNDTQPVSLRGLLPAAVAERERAAAERERVPRWLTADPVNVARVASTATDELTAVVAGLNDLGAGSSGVFFRDYWTAARVASL